MSWAGCQNNLIDLNCHLQKSLEIFYTNSDDKIQSQNYKEVKVPRLMPIRVNPNNCKLLYSQTYRDKKIEIRFVHVIHVTITFIGIIANNV